MGLNITRKDLENDPKLAENIKRNYPDLAKELGIVEKEENTDFDHEDHNGERITPLMVQAVEFHKAFRGYDIAEVDAFLDAVAREIKYLRKKLQKRG